MSLPKVDAHFVPSVAARYKNKNGPPTHEIQTILDDYPTLRDQAVTILGFRTHILYLRFYEVVPTTPKHRARCVAVNASLLAWVKSSY